MTSVGFKLGSPSVAWPELEAMWQRAGEYDVFESAWTNDHLDMGGGIVWEGWTTLALLTRHVPGRRLGHLVLSNPFRHPALLAKAAVAMDHATAGRFVLGLGVGSYPPEFASLGLPLPSLGERLGDLESALRLLRLAFGRDPAGADTGRAISADLAPYRLHEPNFVPPPLTPGGPRIWLGTQGERVGLRLVAQYADGWNFSSEGGLDAFRRKRDALLRHCEMVARDPAEIEISMQLPVGADSAEARRQARAYVDAGTDHVILFLDPTAGVAGVDAVARDVAEAVRDAARPAGRR